MLPAGNVSRGKIKLLNIISVAFLVISLAAITYTTKNQAQVFFSQAKKGLTNAEQKVKDRSQNFQNYVDSKIRKRERESDRGVGPTCDGAWCLAPEIIANQNDPANQTGLAKEIIDTYNAAVNNNDQAALDKLKNNSEALYNQAQVEIAKKQADAQQNQTTPAEQNAEQQNLVETANNLINKLNSNISLSERQSLTEQLRLLKNQGIVSQATYDKASELLQNQVRANQRENEQLDRIVSIDSYYRQAVNGNENALNILKQLDETKYKQAIEERERLADTPPVVPEATQPLQTPTQQVATTSLKENGQICSGDSECGSGYCGIGGGGRGGARSICAVNPGVVAIEDGQNIPNYSSCQSDRYEVTAACNYERYQTQTGLNAITLGQFNPYVQTQTQLNAQYGESITPQRILNTQNLAASSRLGGTIVSEVALLGAVGGFGIEVAAGGALLPAIGNLATSTLSIQAQYSTTNAVSTCALDPKSGQCRKDVVIAALSWANVKTGEVVTNLLLKGTPAAVGAARLANIAVAVPNVAFSGAQTYESCKSGDVAGCAIGGVLTTFMTVSGGIQTSQLVKTIRRPVSNTAIVITDYVAESSNLASEVAKSSAKITPLLPPTGQVAVLNPNAIQAPSEASSMLFSQTNQLSNTQLASQILLANAQVRASQAITQAINGPLGNLAFGNPIPTNLNTYGASETLVSIPLQASLNQVDNVYGQLVAIKHYLSRGSISDILNPSEVPDPIYNFFSKDTNAIAANEAASPLTNITPNVPNIITGDQGISQDLALTKPSFEQTPAIVVPEGQLTAPDSDPFISLEQAYQQEQSPALTRRITDIQNEIANLDIRTIAELLDEAKYTDPLTGLDNRTAFVEGMNLQIASSLEHVTDLTVVSMDLKEFKNINDTLGHLTGDEALKAVADLLKRNARSTDLVIRISGDEFVLILPQTSEAEARLLMQRVLSDLEGQKLLAGADDYIHLVNIDYGVKQWSQDDTVEDFLSHLDLAMYEQKRGINLNLPVIVQRAQQIVDLGIKSLSPIATVISTSIANVLARPLIILPTSNALVITSLVFNLFNPYIPPNLSQIVLDNFINRPRVVQIAPNPEHGFVPSEQLAPPAAVAPESAPASSALNPIGAPYFQDTPPRGSYTGADQEDLYQRMLKIGKDNPSVFWMVQTNGNFTRADMLSLILMGEATAGSGADPMLLQAAMDAVKNQLWSYNNPYVLEFTRGKYTGYCYTITCQNNGGLLEYSARVLESAQKRFLNSDADLLSYGKNDEIPGRYAAITDTNGNHPYTIPAISEYIMGDPKLIMWDGNLPSDIQFGGYNNNRANKNDSNMGIKSPYDDRTVYYNNGQDIVATDNQKNFNAAHNKSEKTIAQRSGGHDPSTETFDPLNDVQPGPPLVPDVQNAAPQNQPVPAAANPADESISKSLPEIITLGGNQTVIADKMTPGTRPGIFQSIGAWFENNITIPIKTLFQAPPTINTAQKAAVSIPVVPDEILPKDTQIINNGLINVATDRLVTSQGLNPFKAHVVSVGNLENAQFVFSPPTELTSTKNFLEITGSDIAINADGYDMSGRTTVNGLSYYKPEGPAIIDGVQYRSLTDEASLYFDASGKLILNRTSDGKLSLPLGRKRPDGAVTQISFPNLLINEGQLQNSSGFDKQLNARTGFGIKNDGEIIIVSVQGSQTQNGSGLTGSTVEELQKLMQAEGVDIAINFDGGGSTSLAANVDGVPTTLNVGADGIDAPVPVHLGIQVDGSANISPADTSTAPIPLNQPQYIAQNQRGAVFFTDNYKPLPKKNFLDEYIEPQGIVLHWDENPYDPVTQPDLFTTNLTYKALIERKTSVHFAVDPNGVTQFMPMKADSITQAYGNSGLGPDINIEFVGIDFDKKLPPQSEIDNAVDLITRLVIQYKLDVNSITHHINQDDVNPEFVELIKNLVKARIAQTNTQTASLTPSGFLGILPAGALQPIINAVAGPLATVWTGIPGITSQIQILLEPGTLKYGLDSIQTSVNKLLNIKATDVQITKSLERNKSNQDIIDMAMGGDFNQALDRLVLLTSSDLHDASQTTLLKVRELAFDYLDTLDIGYRVKSNMLRYTNETLSYTEKGHPTSIDLKQEWEVEGALSNILGEPIKVGLTDAQISDLNQRITSVLSSTYISDPNVTDKSQLIAAVNTRLQPPTAQTGKDQRRLINLLYIADSYPDSNFGKLVNEFIKSGGEIVKIPTLLVNLLVENNVRYLWARGWIDPAMTDYNNFYAPKINSFFSKHGLSYQDLSPEDVAWVSYNEIHTRPSCEAAGFCSISSPIGESAGEHFAVQFWTLDYPKVEMPASFLNTKQDVSASPQIFPTGGNLASQYRNSFFHVLGHESIHAVTLHKDGIYGRLPPDDLVIEVLEDLTERTAQRIETDIKANNPELFEGSLWTSYRKATRFSDRTLELLGIDETEIEKFAANQDPIGYMDFLDTKLASLSDDEYRQFIDGFRGHDNYKEMLSQKQRNFLIKHRAPSIWDVRDIYSHAFGVYGITDPNWLPKNYYTESDRSWWMNVDQWKTQTAPALQTKPSSLSWSDITNNHTATILDVEDIDNLPRMQGRIMAPLAKESRSLYPIEVATYLFFSASNADNGRQLVQQYYKAWSNAEDTSRFESAAQTYLDSREKIYQNKRINRNEQIRKYLTSIYHVQDISEIPTEYIKDLVLVRAMQAIDPLGVDANGNIVIQHTFLGDPTKSTEAFLRTTKHFTINGAVAPVQTASNRIVSWSDKDVILLTPMEEFVAINGIPNTFSVQDTWWTPGTYNSLILPKGTVLIIKKGSPALDLYSHLPGVLIVTSDNPYVDSENVLTQLGYQFKAQNTENSRPRAPEEQFEYEDIFAWKLGSELGLHFNSPTHNIEAKIQDMLTEPDLLNNLDLWRMGNLPDKWTRLVTIYNLITSGYFSGETVYGLNFTPQEIERFRLELRPSDIDRVFNDGDAEIIQKIVDTDKVDWPSYWENEGVVNRYLQIATNENAEPSLMTAMPLLKPSMFGLDKTQEEALRQNVNNLTKSTIPDSEPIIKPNGLIGSAPAQLLENISRATIYKWLPGSAERGTIPVLIDIAKAAWAKLSFRISSGIVISSMLFNAGFPVNIPLIVNSYLNTPAIISGVPEVGFIQKTNQDEPINIPVEEKIHPVSVQAPTSGINLPIISKPEVGLSVRAAVTDPCNVGRGCDGQRMYELYKFYEEQENAWWNQDGKFTPAEFVAMIVMGESLGSTGSENPNTLRETVFFITEAISNHLGSLDSSFTGDKYCTSPDCQGGAGVFNFLGAYSQSAWIRYDSLLDYNRSKSEKILNGLRDQQLADYFAANGISLEEIANKISVRVSNDPFNSPTDWGCRGCGDPGLNWIQTAIENGAQVGTTDFHGVYYIGEGKNGEVIYTRNQAGYWTRMCGSRCKP
jgi:diguanylate cyclase (GGDEF)-like protein